MPDDAPPPEIAGLGFEEALAELERIVRQLEEGSGRLDDAIRAYERGVALRRHCEAKLNEARERVERIVPALDGTARAEPAAIE